MSWRIAVLSLALGACGRLRFHDVPDARADGSTGSQPYRKSIVIDNSRVVGGPHVGFPILIQLGADADLVAHARSDGFDLGFTDASGTALPYEREAYDAATGALVAWVRLPELDASATTLYLVFGSPDAIDQQAPAAVWDASFQEVCHFATSADDSTANHNDGIPNNGLAIGQGRIGAGLVFDGVDDYLDVPASASLDTSAVAGTFSLWIRWIQPAAGTYQMVMSTSNRFVNPRDGFEWANEATGEHYFYPWGGSELDFNYAATPPFTAGAWQYLVVALDYASRAVSIYVDGVALSTTLDVQTLWTQIAQPDDWLWGGNPAMGGPDYFLGEMDEVRIASVVRSHEWIQTEVANQGSPSTFYTVGPIEAR